MAFFGEEILLGESEPWEFLRVNSTEPVLIVDMLETEMIYIYTISLFKRFSLEYCKTKAKLITISTQMKGKYP